MNPPTVVLGADHGGFAMKAHLAAYLKGKGYRVRDAGAATGEASDYPIFGLRVAEAVGRGEAEFGVLLCRSGNGMAMAANKVPGVRAAIAGDVELAELARRHNDANVLVLGADYMKEDAVAVLEAFLSARPEDGRHARRVNIMKQFDQTLASGLTTHQMAAHGQSPWLDDISDELIASGRLGRMIEEEGLRGLTSNPSIFEKAINSGKGRYPADLARLKAQGADAQTAYERLTMEDIAAAADALLPVYDRTGGDDGFVSLEVLPSLAYEEEKSVAEATRLFAELGRPNVMIKVPGTDEGIRAFKRLTAAGVNINVTLIFSRVFYGRIARAYVAGLRERIAAGEDATGVRSVASVFVSRIDTLIDKRLEEMRAAEKDPARREKIDSILHRVAIANTKLIYQDFKSIFMGEEFADLAEAGAAVQRPLWGSTSAKNPDLPDTLYAEELIGAHTVNTLPAATLEAMIDRGRVRGATIEEDVAGARATMKTLAELGIDIEEACMKLQKDGVKSFADAFDKLFAAIQKALGK